MNNVELGKTMLLVDMLDIGKTVLLVDMLDIAGWLLAVDCVVRGSCAHCLFWVFMLKALTGPDHCPVPASMRWLPSWFKKYSIDGISLLFSVGLASKSNYLLQKRMYHPTLCEQGLTCLLVKGTVQRKYWPLCLFLSFEVVCPSHSSIKCLFKCGSFQ